MTFAVEDINNSIASDPYNGWAYRNKGMYFMANEDYVSAIRLLQQAIALEPFVESGYTLLAEAYFKSGDLKKACELWEVAKNNNEVSGDPTLFTCK